MPEINASKGVITQITTVKLSPDTQKDVVALMTERARFMAKQPGFVSVALHRSEDGGHIVNYVQWKDRKQLEAAHKNPEFRKQWPQFGKLAERIEPCLYEVIHIEGR